MSLALLTAEIAAARAAVACTFSKLHVSLRTCNKRFAVLLDVGRTLASALAANGAGRAPRLSSSAMSARAQVTGASRVNIAAWRFSIHARLRLCPNLLLYFRGGLSDDDGRLPSTQY